MEEIGVRDLKARLSSVLRLVERGWPVRVTSRGRPIAEIVPAGSTSLERRLALLEEAGLLTRATQPLPKTLSPPGDEGEGPLASELLIADRDRYR